MSVVFEEECVHLATGIGRRTLTFSEIAEGWSAHVSGDPLTQHLTDFAEVFVGKGLPEDEAFLFVRLVCAWGGLRGDNPSKIRESIGQPGRGTTWLKCVLRKGQAFSVTQEYERAIAAFDDIRGLGISFRSKLLRFLSPDDAAVLDSVIRKKLGYPHNVAGYREFVTDCKAIRDRLKETTTRPDGADWRTADVEMGIFMNVRS